MLNTTAIEIFAKAMNMSEAEMFKQMEQGKILAEDVLPKVAKEYARVARQNGALESAQQKVNSQFQRFLNALTMAKVNFFEGGFGEGMAKSFNIMAEFLKTTDVRAFGAAFGGMISGITYGLDVLLSPVKVLINAFSMLFGTDGAKMAGYALGVGLLVMKVAALAKATMFLVTASRALAITPLGLAITAIGLGATYALSKTMTPAEVAKPQERVSTNIAKQYAQPNRTASTVNVIVQPDGSEFGRAVTARIGEAKYQDKVNNLASLTA
jgi:hypothetical protein